MAETVHVTTTTDQTPALRELVFNLPAILSGRLPDVQGIATGFRTRIGFAILNLIVPNFDNLGRGQSGDDGDKWKPLSRAYLAYNRRFGPTEKSDLKKQAGLSKQHRLAPGDNKGLLTKDQLKLWRKTYSDRLAWYIMRESDAKAKSHAAAVAWIVVKKAGGKTMLDVYGNRTVQILVDTGRGRGSLTPGQMTEQGPTAFYAKPAGKGGGEQVFDTSNPSQVVTGTNVGYMGAHHRGNRRLPKRRLWPEQFPHGWWDSILGTAISGLVRIAEVFQGSRGI